MTEAAQDARFAQAAYEQERNAARGPARGIAVGLALSTIFWLLVLIAWLHFA